MEAPAGLPASAPSRWALCSFLLDATLFLRGSLAARLQAAIACLDLRQPLLTSPSPNPQLVAALVLDESLASWASAASAARQNASGPRASHSASGFVNR